jgi:hypothetical protein
MKPILSALALALPLSCMAAEPTAVQEDVEVLRRLIAQRFAPANTVDVAGQPWTDNRVSMNWSHYILGRGDTLLFQQPSTADTVVDSMTGTLYRPFVYPQQQNIAVWNVEAAGNSPKVEGHHLKGIGVVYALTLPQAGLANLELPVKSKMLSSNCSKCHQTAMDDKILPVEPPARKVVDTWEEQLAILKGRPISPEAPPPSPTLAARDICPQGSLTEIAMGLLTKFGAKFRDLPADERIALALTILPAAAEAPKSAANPPKKTTVQEKLDLIDLHIKQGKNLDALTVVQEVRKLLEEPLTFLQSVPHAQVQEAIDQRRRQLTQVSNKGSQILIQLGRYDEAVEMLKDAKSPNVKVRSNPTEITVVKPKLAARLHVVAAKRDIDDLAAGKLTPEQFRAKIRVDASGEFAPPRKK